MYRILAAGPVALVVLFFAFAPAARAEDGGPDLDARIRQAVDDYMKAQPGDFRAYWSNGLNFETHDKKFKMTIGGRIQLDQWFYDDENLQKKGFPGEWRSGYEFRRVRLYAKGTLWEHAAFKTQLEFAGGGVTFKDVYLRFVKLDKCWGCAFPDVTIGHFKEPFSLEGHSSSRFVTFIERAPVVEAFSPERNTGVGVSKSLYGERITYGLGFFGHETPENGNGFWHDQGLEGGYDVTVRATWLVWAPCECESRFLEVGASASWQDGFRELRYRARPESHLGSRIVDTGVFAAEDVILAGGEMAFGYDRLHVQGEWIGAFVSSKSTGDPNLSGWYVEASWMLTGPVRTFERKDAVFGAVRPCRYFLQDCRGMGALEIAARYSYLDLQDAGVVGGDVSDIAVGLNWYLNVNTRISLDYIYTDVDRAGISDTMNSLGMRFQIWF